MNLSLKDLKIQPFSLINTRGEVLYISDGFERIFFSLISGNSFSEYIHPEERVEFKRWLNNLNHNHQGLVKTFRLIDQNGRVKGAMVRAEPLSDNRIILWFWEEKGSREVDDYWEKALTPAMEAIFSSILDGIFLVNIEGKLIEINEALSEMLGYHKFELIGLPVGKFFVDQPQDIGRATQRFARIMKYGRVKEVNLTLKDRWGKDVEVSFNGAVIREKGRLVGILGVVRDLRRSKLMQKLQEKTLELEQALAELSRQSRLKDDFLSLVGHELRTPLSNILGYAEFLVEGNLDAGERAEYIQVIYQESRRLARLVNEILDLSRMEAGRLIYHHMYYPLDSVLEQAIGVAESEAEKKGIVIEKELGFGKEIWLDPDRIKQVTINFLNNAIKYSPSGTKIWVKSRLQDSGALVSVQDQGVGIEEKDQKKIFEKFGRVEDIEHHHQGAGLGLTIAKGIIEEGHKGKIWVESEGKGKGSIFYFWLPERAPDE